MKVLLVIAAFLVIATLATDTARSQFDDYIVKFNRSYKNDPVEYEQRFINFQNSLKKMHKLQKISPSARFAPNKFSDLSEEEFRARLNPKRPAASLAQSCLANGIEAPRMDASAIPSSFDWRTKGVVNPVKNQEQCGSCWAFSTISVIESQWAIKGNNLTSFSEQLLVDCSTGCCMEDGQQVCNSGCDGGWQWNAFIDIMSWGGVETEAEYPYTGEDGTCQRNTKLTVAPIKNYTCLSGPNAADEDQMAAYLVANGPIAIAMDATILETYSSGVIDPWFRSECDPTQLDHALVIVGYGSESSWFGTLNYWIIRNSWGEDWGEQGYFRIARGYGTCGLNNAVSAVIM